MANNPTRYRHNKTKMIVWKITPTSLYYTGYVDSSVKIPAGLIEKNDEWVLLGEELFVTEDKVQIFAGDHWWYVTMCSNPHVARTCSLTYSGKPENVKPIKKFFYENLAREFADGIKNSPVLSLFELETNAADLKISKTTLNILKQKYLKKA